MTTAFIGILDNAGYNYVEVSHNATPDKAYPLLVKNYTNTQSILALLNQHKSTNKFEPLSNRLLNEQMRYAIKQFVLNLKQPPKYAYVFNTRINKWYCFDVENRGFTSFSKLNCYL